MVRVNLISRKDAKAQGLRHYFTGRPCNKGHIAKRRTGNFNCLDCEADVRLTKVDYIATWQRENKDKVRARNDRWNEANIEQKRAYGRQWIRDNPDKANAATARRRARILQATPKWADQDAITLYYETAAALSAQTGVPYEVDHIVPLQGKNVCGLHVQNNLRVAKQKTNRSKGNKLIESLATA
jgi:hypothetical protein